MRAVTDFGLTETEHLLHFGRHKKSCQNCRYFRLSHHAAAAGDCLLLGRMLSIGFEYSNSIHRERVCDGWKRRPNSWNPISEGINPFWSDPYIERESLKRIRIDALRQARHRAKEAKRGS